MVSSYLDFSIAIGFFLIFTAFLFGHLTNYLTNYKKLGENLELKNFASNIFTIFFTNKGLPENWQTSNIAPVRAGLMNSLYLLLINVTEMDGSYRENKIVWGHIEFDSRCERNISNNSLRLYFNNQQTPFQVYNQSFCEDGSLKKGDIVFNLSLEPYQSKIFHLYFSNEAGVLPPNYSLEFPEDEINYTFETYPIQEFMMISVDKLKALRNFSYEEIVQTLPKGFDFMVEIS